MHIAKVAFPANIESFALKVRTILVVKKSIMAQIYVQKKVFYLTNKEPHICSEGQKNIGRISW